MTTEEATPKAPGGTAMLAGRRVARIGFGAMQLAEQRAGHPAPDRQVSMAVLRAAVEQGVNHIDTAQFYGAGACNELIRDSLHPFPEDLVLASKVGADHASGQGRLVPAQRPEEIWRNLPEEFCREVEVVNGQAIRCDSPSRAHQTAVRRLANMLESSADEHQSLHADSRLDVNSDFDVTLWQVPTTTIRRPDVALFACAPEDLRPLPVFVSEGRCRGRVARQRQDRPGREDGRICDGRHPLLLARLGLWRQCGVDRCVRARSHHRAYRLFRTFTPEDEVSTIEVPIRIKVEWNRLSNLVR